MNGYFACTQARNSSAGAGFAMMKTAEADAIVSAVARWAIKRTDIRAMALVGSWARGNPRHTSDIDLLLLSDRVHDYRRRQEWLTEIDLADRGYRLHATESATYGAVWSLHLRLIPAAEVELAFAGCSWAQTEPLDDGTRSVVKDGLRIILDKDAMLAKLMAAVKHIS